MKERRKGREQSQLEYFIQFSNISKRPFMRPFLLCLVAEKRKVVKEKGMKFSMEILFFGNLFKRTLN